MKTSQKLVLTLAAFLVLGAAYWLAASNGLLCDPALPADAFDACVDGA